MRTGMAAAVGVALSLNAAPVVMAQGFEFGVKLGPSLAVVAADGDEGQGYDRRIALAGGVFMVLPVTDSFNVQVEALYTPKGANFADGNAPGTSALLLDYLDIPVLARVDVPRSPALHVFAGPYVGFRRRAKLEYAQDVGAFRAGSREDIRRVVKGSEAGLVAGGGLDIGRHAAIDARYCWGLTNVNSDPGGPRIRNRVLLLLAGVRF